MTDVSELAVIRGALAELDARIVRLVAERVELGRAAGAAKRRAGLAIRDEDRERATLTAVAAHADELGLDARAVRDVFERLIAMTRAAQDG